MQVGRRMLAATKHVLLNPGCTRQEVAGAIGRTGADAEGREVVTRTLQYGLIEEHDGALRVTEEGILKLAAVAPTLGLDPATGIPVRTLQFPPRAEFASEERTRNIVRYALRGIDLGLYDHQIVEWLVGLYREPTGRAVLSLIERARIAERSVRRDTHRGLRRGGF